MLSIIYILSETSWCNSVDASLQTIRSVYLQERAAMRFLHFRVSEGKLYDLATNKKKVKQ